MRDPSFQVEHAPAEESIDIRIGSEGRRLVRGCRLGAIAQLLFEEAHTRFSFSREARAGR